jgi:hypothetical protein
MIWSPRWKFPLILGIVVVFCGLVFWGAQEPQKVEKAVPVAEAPKKEAIAPPSSSTHNTIAAEKPSFTPAPLPASGVYSEEQGTELISQLLLDDSLEHEAVARQLLTLLPRFAPDQQEEAAQHISNLAEDNLAGEYAKMLVSNSLPAPVAEVFFSDLMNRSQEMLIPTLSQIADQPNHPQKQDSIDVLEVLYGTPESGLNWQSWTTQQMAAEQP